ncbi:MULTISPECIES: DUF3085 domain-containing protein [Sulfitobacter]|uniref:DUF3085 domain-containing protein n=1 Tax=Sulfitobacter geojensis TaxID=1342299 RepID=A0AAE3B8L2_9RHOB|nr:DUF3085 domain-containing protein [Sulfitobacter geojensis]MBM1691436.1 DUF3085 domain-containing protein [Sulfitobacter geojensis]MBM1695502.1 DUF3085 domain-containing protein [Sulfitobacter geojensis]MBM1707690.1 DUF3085 domain-containing protein [Sulfitobacter geojensis]MBM1711752.1 DUF3085 domain-containing protein [Sulfitobacter geojensis]MBM1715815.1 DUF3085 domain-containing protein [Sulfitobacter geojensis]
MALLEFATPEVAKIIKHAQSCTRFMRKWDGEVTQPGLILSVAQGVFLMSNGLDATSIKEVGAPDTNGMLVYADGKNPQVDPNWVAEVTAIFCGYTGIYHLDIIQAAQQIITRGDPTLMLCVSNHVIDVFDPRKQTPLIGQIYKTPSGLGGVFHVKILDLTATHAWVRNHGNSEDFDNALPYRVPLDKIYPIEMKGAA